MNVLVTGAHGQLGREVVTQLQAAKITYTATNRHTLDITDEQQVRTIFAHERPQVVIHCAAYTAVDLAEQQRELCYAVNVRGTANVALACREVNATLIYVSSDYVFDGHGDEPFATTSRPYPLNYYGWTKYWGELAVQRQLSRYFIVRVSWVFGHGGHHFVNTILKLAQQKTSLNVVADQFGSPTYTVDLAALLLQMMQTTRYGVYHATNEGVYSWYEFARAILQEANCSTKIEPILSSQYKTLAQRPLNSRLCKNSLREAGFSPLPPVMDALHRYMKVR